MTTTLRSPTLDVADDLETLQRDRIVGLEGLLRGRAAAAPAAERR